MSDQNLKDFLEQHPEFNDEELLRELEELSDEDVLEEKPSPDLQQTMTALVEEKEGRPSPTVVYGLSGLMCEDMEKLRETWNNLPQVRRRRVMRELVEAAETNIELDYRTVGLMGLGDSDPRVRETAIEVLWEDESLELMNRLVTLARHDEVVEVRAAAAIALGRFILLGELGDLPEAETYPARDAVISLLNQENEDNEVRRRALESIANCTHEMVPQAIKSAYASTDRRMRVSAVFAMGRTCDEAWEDIILREIESDDPEMQYEAAKAAGELELVESVPRLGRLALGEDREIQTVAIWSLGEIGGREAVRILELVMEKAEDEDDDDLLQAAEDAIGNASLAGEDVANMWTLPLDEFDLDEE